jgi:hypothetical protein
MSTFAHSQLWIVIVGMAVAIGISAAVMMANIEGKRTEQITIANIFVIRMQLELQKDSCDGRWLFLPN